MTKEIKKKCYYRIGFTLKSPLAIGSGGNTNTDKDIIRNSFGHPYIPASAIAGVCSHAVKEENIYPQQEIYKYLGFVRIKGNETEEDDSTKDLKDAMESRVIFYDGQMMNGKDTYFVSARDSVALDEYKTAKRGAKFDMEVLEPGIRFVTYLEQDYYDGDTLDFAAQLARLFLAGKISFGGKNTRGYGEIKDVQVGWRQFILAEHDTDGDGFEEWLNFDLYDENGWKEWTEAPITTERKLTLRLKQVGGISIRRYTTRIRDNEQESQPDFEQMTVHHGAEELPVIPGTSWAGAFRHRMRELGLQHAAEEKLFGFVRGEGQDEKARSRIRFSETIIQEKDGKGKPREKILSRNAIDRFSGGTVDGALFTEKTYYGGMTDLEITLQGKEALTEQECRILVMSIADLHYGFLAVGGETSIGRGLFSILQVNGKDIVDGDTVYEQLWQEIKGVMSE